MFDPSQALSGFRIPADLLIAMDNRDLHYALQPYHYLIRAMHVLSAAAFFGGIVVLDLRLLGVRATAPLRGLTELALPWIYLTFAITLPTGLALFLYDPLQVGSHAYFTLKLLFILLGLANALMVHWWSLAEALKAEVNLPRRAAVGGAVSLGLWVLVMVCASLNAEGAPKVLLTGDADTVVSR